MAPTKSGPVLYRAMKVSVAGAAAVVAVAVAAWGNPTPMIATSAMTTGEASLDMWSSPGALRAVLLGIDRLKGDQP